MNLLIKKLTGKTISIEADYNDTIFNLKNMIERQENIPYSEQTLVFNCKILEEMHTLSDFKDELLYLVLKLRGGFQVFVKTLEGRTIAIDCENDNSIETLRKKISDKLGEEMDNYFLYYGSKNLDNNKLLKIMDLGIPKEATFMLVRRTNGGIFKIKD